MIIGRAGNVFIGPKVVISFSILGWITMEGAAPYSVDISGCLIKNFRVFVNANIV